MSSRLCTKSRYCFIAIQFFLLWTSLLQSTLIDLEEQYFKKFVTTTKRIHIPGYPEAYNPSIVRWKGKYLLSFRYQQAKYVSYIGLIWLDDSFHPKGAPQLLNMRSSTATAPHRADDARLLTVGNDLYIVYSDNVDSVMTRGGFRVYIARVVSDKDFFTLENVQRLSDFEGESKNIREKNWVPFDYQGKLLLAYSLIPHKIVQPLPNSETCTTVESTTSEISWNWGIPRGGTPGILLENGQYLSFFHSSIDIATAHSDGKSMLHYFMGAYTFASTPPFSITAISTTPIVSKKFYRGISYKGYWKPVKVIFPCGFVHNNKYIWVAYGRDDHEIWIAQLDKEKLLKSLAPVHVYTS